MTWWRHQMETFSALLVICARNSPVNSAHKGQWRGALMFPLISTWINAWVNNREAGDLRRYSAHYDVIVMIWSYCTARVNIEFRSNVELKIYKIRYSWWAICSSWCQNHYPKSFKPLTEPRNYTLNDTVGVHCRRQPCDRGLCPL